MLCWSGQYLCGEWLGQSGRNLEYDMTEKMLYGDVYSGQNGDDRKYSGMSGPRGNGGDYRVASDGHVGGLSTATENIEVARIAGEQTEADFCRRSTPSSLCFWTTWGTQIELEVGAREITVRRVWWPTVETLFMKIETLIGKSRAISLAQAFIAIPLVFMYIEIQIHGDDSPLPRHRGRQSKSLDTASQKRRDDDDALAEVGVRNGVVKYQRFLVSALLGPLGVMGVGKPDADLGADALTQKQACKSNEGEDSSKPPGGRRGRLVDVKVTEVDEIHHLR
ncbi:hypothetical protein BDN72DRAFT_855012 [Pluteus cervinus]|uniref:Uncharacterized protein n=1 Tax=Pluteus cervinus TaxID=181527 RepID=A0ACD3B682_9AGAR|nr:hypothetical protein BDN72DRAFT_855012 [Pluteus cervinus]